MIDADDSRTTPECTEEHFSMLDQVSPRGGGRHSPSLRHSSTVQRREANEEDPRGAAAAAGSSAQLSDRTATSAAGRASVTFDSTMLHPGSGLVLNGDEEDRTRSQLHLFADEREQLQEYWVKGDGTAADGSVTVVRPDDVFPPMDHDGAFHQSPPVFGRRSTNGRSRVRRFLVDTINLGAVGVAICLMLMSAGLVCRLSPGLSRNVHDDAGRFLMSAGAFGLASALSNYVAVKVLLLTMFLSRHESVLQNSVRDIVMNIFFSKDRIEEQLVAHIRKAVSTTSVTQTVQAVLAHERTVRLVRRYLDQFLHYTREGMMLSMMGVSQETLEPFLVPAVLSVLSDVAPIVGDIMRPGDLITPDVFFDAMERVVSHRTASLDVEDLKGIVSGVLSPHLSILVLWGSLFGILLGLVAEALTFSHFLSGCMDS